MTSGTAAAVGLVLLLLGGVGVAVAATSGDAKKDDKKKPPAPDPSKKTPPGPQPGPGKWGRVRAMNQGGVSVFAIPANTTFAIAMDDSVAARAVLAGFQSSAPGKWTVTEPGAPRAADWPKDDDEGPLALRAEGSLPFPFSFPAAGAVRALWQWVPATELPIEGTTSPPPRRIVGGIVAA